MSEMAQALQTAMRMEEARSPRVRSAQISSGDATQWTGSVDSQGPYVSGARALGPQSHSVGDHVYMLTLDDHQNPMAWQPSPFRSSMTTPGGA